MSKLREKIEKIIYQNSKDSDSYHISIAIDKIQTIIDQIMEAIKTNNEDVFEGDILTERPSITTVINRILKEELELLKTKKKSEDSEYGISKEE